MQFASATAIAICAWFCAAVGAPGGPEGFCPGAGLLPQGDEGLLRERVRIGGTEPVPGHAGRPVPHGLLELAVLDHVGADVVVQRLDEGHGVSELGVVEVRQDVEALARGRLRPGGQVAERRAGRTGTRAGPASPRSGGDPGQEALLSRQCGPYVAPWPVRLREGQAAVRAYRVRCLAGVLPIAGVVHARGVQGVVGVTGGQAVVVDGAEPGVGRERLRRQGRRGGDRGGRAADGGRRHRRVRSLGRGRAGGEDGAGGEDWAAGHQAQPVRMRIIVPFQGRGRSGGPRFTAYRRAASGLVRAARSAGYAPASRPTTLPISGAGKV